MQPNLTPSADDDIGLDPAELLFVAAVRLAIRDATNTGDIEAVDFLNDICPSWRCMAKPGHGARSVFKPHKRGERPPRTKRERLEKKNHGIS